MAHFRKNIYQHLRSAKGWLTKAEEAFDKERDVRGELNLMLAQAELQHVKEVNRSQHWRYKYAAVRHGVAITCAVVIAAGLGGVYWWTNKAEVAAPIPLLTNQVSLSLETNIPIKSNVPPVVPIYKEQEKGKLAAKEDVPPVQHTAVSNSISQQRKVEQPEQAASVAVSSDEMQKLVRAAGKSLRGQ